MSFWSGRPVFVTGATRLLGSWLVKQLLAEGAEVIALVRDQSRYSMLTRDGLLERCTVVEGDLLDFSLLRRSLSKYSVDTVFHLAAQPLVGIAKLDPMSTLEINVRGTWHVLEAARLTQIKQTVVASSGKAYGDAGDRPSSETDRLQGSYPYDVSKSCSDLIAMMYANTYKLPVSIVRCANLYGGGDLNFSRAIPGSVQATLQGEPFIIRSDGQYVRDFLYVEDAALGYMRVAECLAHDPDLIGEPFNMSLEIRLSVLDIINAVRRLMDRSDLEPVILNQTTAENREEYMNCEKAHRLLGWWPAHSFERGLEETIEWYRGYFGAAMNSLAMEAAAR